MVCKNGSKFGLESEKTACLVCNSSADFGFGSITLCGVLDNALFPFQRDDGFQVRGAREQIERLHFLDAVAVAFPFLDGGGNFVGAAEHVAYAHGLAHGERVDDAGFAALAGRVKQNFFALAGNGAREPCLHEVLVDLARDEAVILLEVACGCLRAVDGGAFHLDAQHRLGGLAQREAEKPVTAVQIEEVVFLGKRKHAPGGLDEVVDLALVHLAETGGGVLEAEMPQIERKFARAKELLEGEPFGGPLGLEIVIRLCRVNVGVCRSHVIWRFLQNFGNLLQFTDNCGVNFLDIEYHDPVLVGAADDNPVECVGEGLVRRRDELFEQQAVYGVVLLGLQDAVVFVEAQVAGLHVDAPLAGGAVVAGHGARGYGLRGPRKPVYLPKFANGAVFYLQFRLVVQRGESLAVGGIGFLGVVGEIVGYGLFEEHA